MHGVIFFFLLLCGHLVKCDGYNYNNVMLLVNYVMTEFDYAKCDSCHAVYRGVVSQLFNITPPYVAQQESCFAQSNLIGIYYQYMYMPYMPCFAEHLNKGKKKIHVTLTLQHCELWPLVLLTGNTLSCTYVHAFLGALLFKTKQIKQVEGSC